MEKTHPQDDTFQTFYLICHYFWTSFCRLPVLLINWKHMTWVCIPFDFGRIWWIRLWKPFRQIFNRQNHTQPRKICTRHSTERYQEWLFLHDKERVFEWHHHWRWWCLFKLSKQQKSHLMMKNSKMLRSSIRVMIALVFINLEMDVIMRLLTWMQKKYIP